MLSKSFILMSLAVATQADAQAQQFDLICESHYHDATFHYRVDLGANEYCFTFTSRDIWLNRSVSNACPTYAIGAVASDTIVFNDYAPDHLVDRMTGAWVYKDGGTLFRGTCTKAPFSGFPKLETKF